MNATITEQEVDLEEKPGLVPVDSDRPVVPVIRHEEMLVCENLFILSYGADTIKLHALTTARSSGCGVHLSFDLS